ncbi:uncharacterized protein LOC124116187 [Haliotis rufescens]|uniref:uncharacterized protein LOC124116187 n=1 Tax=Haliotis rufescens TaxID=6454 RepID=UPI00201F319E|nr:uncharacterized protein LOC124116187 [Haliotis rufescens]
MFGSTDSYTVPTTSTHCEPEQQATDMSCSKCEKKYKACIDNINERNTLHMDVAQSILFHLRKETRQTFKEKLLKKVCSLRNSRGGILVIHVTGRDQKFGPSLDRFDEVENDLSNMIEDDTPFCENYTRYWIDGCQGVESGAGHRYTDYILLHVSGSGSISTRDFNTYMPRYGSIIRPKARELAGVLTRVSTETKPHEENNVNKQEIKVKGREKKRLLSGYKSRDVQFKRLRLTDSQKKTETNDGNNIREQNINNITNKVMDRLSDYVTAFTKLTEGGAIYYGIEEEKGQEKERKKATRSQTGDGPPTHHYVVNGILMSPDMHEVVKANIMTDITENMLWHNEQGDKYGEDEINNLVEISFHSTSEAEVETAVGTAAGEEDTYVIEVRVKGNFRGIAFTSKTGPCADRLDDKKDTIAVDIKDWEKRIKLLQTNSPAQPVTSSPQAGQ